MSSYHPFRGPERVMLLIVAGVSLAVISMVVYVLGYFMRLW
jgi:hypothetical protein